MSTPSPDRLRETRLVDCPCGCESFYAMVLGDGADRVVELRCADCGGLIRPLDPDRDLGNPVEVARGDAAHWQNVVRAAHRLADDPDHVRDDGRVALYREDVADSTTISVVRAQQLMDEWADPDSDRFKKGVALKAYERGTAANGYEPRKKHLLIDPDRWQADGSRVEVAADGGDA